MKTINLQNILAITRKELRASFNSPTAYIVLVVFLLLWEFLFFSNVFLIGETSLRSLFTYLPWLFLLFIPAITMGSISQERSEGTIELLLTHPLRDIELIIGKFLGSLGFVALTLTVVLPLAWSIGAFGNLDWGVVVGQYFGSLFFAATLIALGIFVSTLFVSQISALLVATALSFFYIILGFDFVTATVPAFLVPVFERLSVLSHFESMSRGLIDVRDLWYFFSAIVVFLSSAYLFLLKRRYGNQRSLYRSYQIGITLFIGIAVLTNIIGSRIPGRIDLTEDKLYTLTDATKKTVGGLDDVVNITLFASNELPAQLQPVLRDTKDMLRDYQTLGKGNIIVSTKNPATDPEATTEAQSLGVEETRFNVIGEGEYQMKTGYLGVAVAYGGKNETIPFLRDTADLEYQLTSFIKKLTDKDKKEIAFLSGHGEKSLFQDYRALSSELEKQFEVKEVTIDEKTQEFSEKTVAIVVAGPNQEVDEKTRAAIAAFLSKGGSAFFLLDPVTVTPQALVSSATPESFTDFLKEYGVDVTSDLAYDLRSNEAVNFGGGGRNSLSYVLPYPFWARVGAVDQTSPVTGKIESVLFPWASPVVLDEAKLKGKGFSATKLLATTRFGGKVAAGASIAPDKKLPQEKLGEQLIAVGLEGASAQVSGPKSRIVVVGDSDFISDEFVQNAPENIAFASGALAWLGQEESLAGIRIKQKAERRLFFEDATQVAMVKYGNMSLALLLPAGYGAFRLIRRRGLGKLTYTSNNYE